MYDKCKYKKFDIVRKHRVSTLDEDVIIYIYIVGKFIPFKNRQNRSYYVIIRRAFLSLQTFQPSL